MNALVRSMELPEGDSFDWYFVAMIHAQQGRLDKPPSGTTRRRPGIPDINRATKNCNGFEPRRLSYSAFPYHRRSRQRPGALHRQTRCPGRNRSSHANELG